MPNKFPDFKACMKRMRDKDSQVMEDGFHTLLPLASEYVPELIAAFRDEKDYGLRCWLIELVGEAKSPAAFPFLVESLNDEDASIKQWALRGLQKIDTKEARAFLWERRFDLPDEMSDQDCAKAF